MSGALSKGAVMRTPLEQAAQLKRIVKAKQAEQAARRKRNAK